MKVRIIEPAEQDLLDGYLFYESEANPWLYLSHHENKRTETGPRGH